MRVAAARGWTGPLPVSLTGRGEGRPGSDERPRVRPDVGVGAGEHRTLEQPGGPAAERPALGLLEQLPEGGRQAVGDPGGRLDDLVGDRLAGEVPHDGPQLRRLVEAQAVVDPPQPTCRRVEEEVAALAVRVVGEQVEAGDPPQRRTLARVSRTPGRTQAIKSCDLDPGQRLVDLPGYGYAKVPEALRRSWGPLLEQYLRRRGSLRGLILVMDIRHPYGPHDADLIAFAAGCGRPVHVLLNKADKLSRGAAIQEMARPRGFTGFDGVPMEVLFAPSPKQIDRVYMDDEMFIG